jgi:hypothetical protein
MTVMTEEWVSFWYQALLGNMDYACYCDARKNGNVSQCREYEGRFEHIGQIYDDFGFQELWPEDGLKNRGWKKWFSARRHLFMDVPREVSDIHLYIEAEDKLLVEVPLHANPDSTIEAFRQFVTEWYETNNVKPVAPPKYKLHEVEGRVAHGFEQVRQACIVSTRCYAYDLQDLEVQSVNKGMLDFLRDEIDNLGWTLDPRARKTLQETGKMDQDRFLAFKVRINKCRREYAALSRNVIRCRFPDLTDFDSNVIDLFKDE